MNAMRSAPIPPHTRMVPGLLPLILLALMPFVNACTWKRAFPENGGPAIWTTQEFQALTGDQDTFQGHQLRLAGRIVRAEGQNSRFLILAQWLPFPTDEYSLGGPTDSSSPSLYITYSAEIDEEGLEAGNEFLVAGTLSGTREYVPLIGPQQQAPVIAAECVTIWKTAGTDLSEFTIMHPLDPRYPPPLAKTYCIEE